ncbi:hypothetical protein AVEN_184302-1 [Araneus ventricosus]|uniref:Uncharacterized protein n=1 Tax=Araneus ventricosus TaxID=182803 RepID=A0A4Y2P5R7_ARAVE|nr:hypothetical protein AVEN_78834-1 [Araneus ventricosus]GBN46776.1 hypothetical protein AVEN_184302-1 [Araneus ventricosus]
METNDLLRIQCCNPLMKSNHFIRDRKKLRNVTAWMSELFPQIANGSKICDKCRKEITMLKYAKPISDKNLDSFASETISDEDPDFAANSVTVQTLNTSLQELGESPIDKRKVKSKRYATSKVKKISSSMKWKLFVAAENSSSENDNEIDESILQNLKSNFLSSTSRTKKLMLLTCLPENWSVRKIMREFNAPNYIVRQSKKILKEKGILEGPNSKPGKNLPIDTVGIVRSFYENDEVSRAMPGIKDCVTVIESNGSKSKISKRLILCNLKEAYQYFKDKLPSIKIGFSKFAELRPKHCILAGQSGTHSVCVCTTHQNVKLMIENAKLNTLTNGNIKNYKQCLVKMLCNPSAIGCNMGNCAYCPGETELRTILQESFDENLIEQVQFRQWISVDRCNLEILEKSSEEFIDLFCSKLSFLVRHDFIAKQQRAFFNYRKENLKESEFLVTCDFSGNYSIVLQDEAQSYHWTSQQVTIHPFVIYFKQENKVEHVSYVVVSDCLEHNTVAVYTFQKKLVSFLIYKFQKLPDKIFYFSDGSAAQYKNKKNFLNLCFHEEDFKVKGEWHFSATAQGKGPCDGIGGSVKRLAARASLQRSYENQIQTPRQIFEWTVENITKVDFAYSTQEEYVESELFLKNRFDKALTIQGTQHYHAFIPKTTSTLLVKYFSDDLQGWEKEVSKSPDKLKIEDIPG